MTQKKEVEPVQANQLDFEIKSEMSNNKNQSGHLRMAQIRFLALEGGGGKGFAYLGAIRTLEEMGILQFKNHRVVSHNGGKQLIQGFAGASAGAITALLLSCGYSSQAIEHILTQVDFSTLFDIPELGRIPGLYEVTCPFPPLETNREKSLLGKLLEQIGSDLKEDFIPFLYLLSLTAPLNSQTPPMLYIFKDWRATEACLKNDWGVFCGDKFFDVFGRLIRGALQHKISDLNQEPDYTFLVDENYKPIYKWTFADHASAFTKLGVMASNLETHKSIFFSPDTTPDFPVAAAVRISMGLPIIFKPFLITLKQYPKLQGVEDLIGVYVDGGLFNNVPLTVIDEVWGKELGEGTRTLALRLEEERQANINDIFSYLRSWTLDTGAFGSGESQIQKTLGTSDRTILLKTDGLNLFDFAPPPSDVKKQIWQDAVERVCEYFGSDPKKFISSPTE